MQLKRDADPALRFASMRYLEKQNIAPSIDNYEILYRGNLPTGKRSVPQPELLEQLYQKFNCAQPMDYHGHSLSVSDVILLNQAGKISAHYVDSIGFRELSGFQDKQERSSVLANSGRNAICRNAIPQSAGRGGMTMQFNHDELMLMMLYNTGTRQGLVQELRLMQCYLMPDETALRELSEQVITKLKLLTDAEFAGLEFPMN